LVGLAHAYVRLAAILIGRSQLRRDVDRLVEVRYREGGKFLVQISQAAVVVRQSVVGVEKDRITEIVDRAVVVALVQLRVAGVVKSLGLFLQRRFS